MSEKKTSSENANQPIKSTLNDAYEQAEKDIEKDPELNNVPGPDDDLDEGELARLEGED